MLRVATLLTVLRSCLAKKSVWCHTIAWFICIPKSRSLCLRSERWLDVILFFLTNSSSVITSSAMDAWLRVEYGPNLIHYKTDSRENVHSFIHVKTKWHPLRLVLFDDQQDSWRSMYDVPGPSPCESNLWVRFGSAMKHIEPSLIFSYLSVYHMLDDMWHLFVASRQFSVALQSNTPNFCISSRWIIRNG